MRISKAALFLISTANCFSLKAQASPLWNLIVLSFPYRTANVPSRAGEHAWLSCHAHMLTNIHTHTRAITHTQSLIHTQCTYTQVQRRRPDLRLIVASATLQAEELRAFFDPGRDSSVVKTVQAGPGAPAQRAPAIISIEGRTHPVEVRCCSVDLRDGSCAISGKTVCIPIRCVKYAYAADIHMCNVPF
eukprot:1137281-Pelagomonas_calceolata.AAC.6